jgi:hypothetical protein
MSTLLIVLGIILIVTGIAWWGAEALGFAGRLPGDIVIERPGMRIYFPLMTSLIISVVLSLILWLLSR